MSDRSSIWTFCNNLKVRPPLEPIQVWTRGMGRYQSSNLTHRVLNIWIRYKKRMSSLSINFLLKRKEIIEDILVVSAIHVPQKSIYHMESSLTTRPMRVIMTVISKHRNSVQSHWFKFQLRGVLMMWMIWFLARGQIQGLVSDF